MQKSWKKNHGMDGECSRRDDAGEAPFFWVLFSPSGTDDPIKSVVWNLDVILTDRTRDWLDLRAQLDGVFFSLISRPIVP